MVCAEAVHHSRRGARRAARWFQSRRDDGAGRCRDSAGVYLEVVPNERLVFTDAFTSAWEPREGAPFMVVIVTLEDEGGKTRYTAHVRHWTVDARERHEAMGFYNGWGICAEQLETAAKGLQA